MTLIPFRSSAFISTDDSQLHRRFGSKIQAAIYLPVTVRRSLMLPSVKMIKLDRFHRFHPNLSRANLLFAERITLWRCKGCADSPCIGRVGRERGSPRSPE